MQYEYQGVNMHTLNIVNLYRNRSSKITSSYILLLQHGRRLNSTVSNHAHNINFGRMIRWFWKYRFHMQYDYEGVEIALSILEFQRYSIDNESISEYRIIEHLVIWTWQTIEFKRIKSCKQLEFRKNAAMLLAVSMSYAIWAWRSRDSHIIIRNPNIVNW